LALLSDAGSDDFLHLLHFVHLVVYFFIFSFALLSDAGSDTSASIALSR
jgi:hypothetical protein